MLIYIRILQTAALCTVRMYILLYHIPSRVAARIHTFWPGRGSPASNQLSLTYLLPNRSTLSGFHKFPCKKKFHSVVLYKHFDVSYPKSIYKILDKKYHKFCRGQYTRNKNNLNTNRKYTISLCLDLVWFSFPLRFDRMFHTYKVSEHCISVNLMEGHGLSRTLI